MTDQYPIDGVSALIPLPNLVPMLPFNSRGGTDDGTVAFSLLKKMEKRT